MDWGAIGLNYFLFWKIASNQYCLKWTLNPFSLSLFHGKLHLNNLITELPFSGKQIRMWEGYYQGADKNSPSQTQCSCSVSTLNWHIFAPCAWRALDTGYACRNTALNMWGFALSLFKRGCKPKQTPQRASEVHTSLTSSGTTLLLLTPPNTHTTHTHTHTHTQCPVDLWRLCEWWRVSHSHSECSCHVVESKNITFFFF